MQYTGIPQGGQNRQIQSLCGPRKGKWEKKKQLKNDRQPPYKTFRYNLHRKQELVINLTTTLLHYQTRGTRRGLKRKSASRPYKNEINHKTYRIEAVTHRKNPPKAATY